jgi:hypothetical protein
MPLVNYDVLAVIARAPLNRRKLKRALRRIGIIGLSDVVDFKLGRYVEGWRFDQVRMAFYRKPRAFYARRP